MNHSPLQLHMSQVREVEPALRWDGVPPIEQHRKACTEKLRELLGMDTFTPCEPLFEITEEDVVGGHRHLHFTLQTEEGYFTHCDLLLPQDQTGRLPLCVCLQGHTKGAHVSLGITKYPGDEQFNTPDDQGFCIRAVAEGFAALAIEQRGFGACGGTPHGPACERPATEGKKVDMPTFDFANQRRSDVTVPLERKKGEIFFFEGIHALNPDVLPDHSFSQRVYVWPDAEIELDGGNLGHQHIRLLRRLMRDKTHRGSSFENTLRKFRSVCRGERLFIDPYKDSADIFINTFVPYEFNVYASVLRGSLSGIEDTLLRETGADRLMQLLEVLTPIAVQDVSGDALIQEFLGKS